jgi:spore photoproduct lyase
MTKSEKSFYNPDFSHVYVEKRISDHPKTLRILDLLPKSAIIYIDHYKDVFCKSGQSYESQAKEKSSYLQRKQTHFYTKDQTFAIRSETKTSITRPMP